MKRLALLFLALLLLVSAAGAEEVWEKSLGEKITAVATDEYGGRIFVGTESGMLYCYDASGSVVWSSALPYEITEIHSEQNGAKIHVEATTNSYVVSGEDGATLITEPHTGSSNVAIARDGTRRALLRNTASGTWSYIYIFDEDNNVIFAGLDTKIGANAANDVVMSGSGDWVVLQAISSDTLSFWEINYHDPTEWLYYSARAPIYRQKLTITNNEDLPLTNGVIQVTCYKGSGTDSGQDVYFGLSSASLFNNAFEHVWFTQSDGVTLVPYNRTAYTSGTSGTFDVQMTGTVAPKGTYDLYIYYYTPWGTSASAEWADPYEIIFEDDFEDGVIDPQWTVTKGASGVVQEVNGYLEIKSPGANGRSIVRGSTYSESLCARYNVSVLSTYDAGNKNLHRFGKFSSYADQGVFDWSDHTPLQAYFGAWTGLPATLNTPQIMEIWYDPAGNVTWKYGSDWTLNSSASTTFSVFFEAGQTGSTETGHMMIYDVMISKWPMAPETISYAWGDVECQVQEIDTQTFTGTVVDIDAPETGDWVAVSTTSKTYIVQITDSGFGTIYSDDRAGTAYNVQVADSGSFVIEGRSILADIFRIDAVQVGTYTTGGAVQHVAIAQKNGLYAAAGSDDGKYYVFSKDATSAWYLLYGSDSYDPVTALAMPWRGEYTVIGRSDGRLTVFQASEDDTDGVLRITVFKENAPYTNQTLYVEDGGMDQEWGAPTQVTTDDYGVAAVPVTWGHYTRITVGDDELVKVIVASAAQTGYVFRVPGAIPLRTGAQFGSSYDSATQRIYLSYDDTRDTTHLVVYEVARVSDGVVVYSENFTAFPVSDYYQIPAGWTNTSYRVSLTASGSPSFTNTWSQWVGTAGVATPPGELDNFMKMGISFFLILFVAGLFSYLSGPQGAVVVSLLAGALVLWGWLPIAPTIVALCIVWAFLGLLGRTAGEG